MAQYKVPPLNLNEPIVDKDGKPTNNFLNFLTALSDLTTQNFNTTGIKIPDNSGDLSLTDNNGAPTPDGTQWTDNSTNPPTIKVILNGQIKTITTS
jgi:hypothetical protein